MDARPSWLASRTHPVHGGSPAQYSGPWPRPADGGAATTRGHSSRAATLQRTRPTHHENSGVQGTQVIPRPLCVRGERMIDDETNISRAPILSLHEANSRIRSLP